MLRKSAVILVSILFTALFSTMFFTGCEDALLTEPAMAESAVLESPMPGDLGAFSLAKGKPTSVGFDEYGYNYAAQVFVGPADGVDRNLDGTVWGDLTYANDHLKMKWSNGWDDARFHDGTWGPDAYEDNQWNGQVPSGSGEVWHYRIIWVGPDPEQSEYWREGGYVIWDQFEVIMSHGTVANEHIWETHALPTGYGSGGP